MLGVRGPQGEGETEALRKHMEIPGKPQVFPSTGARELKTPHSVPSCAWTWILLGDLEREKQLAVAARTATTG